MVTITKKNLINLVESNSKLNKKKSRDFFENFLEVIIKNIESGEPVKIHEFGNFSLRSKKERKGRNPITKEEYMISARKTISFRTSNILKVKIRQENNN